MGIITYIGFSEVIKFVILFITTYVAHYYYKYFTRPNPLPGPFPLPFIGNLYLFSISDYTKFLKKSYQQYGELYEFYLGRERIISIGNVNLIDKLLSASSKSSFKLRGKYNPGLVDYEVSGYGLGWNHDIESWQFNRQFFTHALLTPAFTQLAINSTQKFYHELTSYWDQLEENQVTDLREWMVCYITDNIYELMMDKRGYTMVSYFTKITGIETNISKGLIEESKAFLDGYNSYKDGYVFYAFSNSLVRKLPGFRNLAIKYKKSSIEYFKLILGIITKHKEEINSGSEGDKKLKNDIMTLMLKYNPEQDESFSTKVNERFKRPLTDKELSINMIEAAGGGIDSTAYSFTFLTYFLCQNPEVRDKVRKEAESVLGKNPRQFTMEDFEKFPERFPYSDAVLKENARMASVAPVIDRINVEQDELGGLKWPAYSHFAVNIVGIHSDKRYWNDPEKFIPERHLNPASGEYKSKALLTFGKGLRYCPGRKLAMTEMRILLLLTCLQFDIELVDKASPLDVKYTFFNQPSPLPVRIKRRK